MLCKHGDERRNKRAVKDRCVIGSLVKIMRREYIHGDEERVRNSILPTLTIRDLDME